MKKHRNDRRIRVADRNLNVHVDGDGPVVLLLHGIPTNHQLWRDVIPRLAKGAQVVAVDMLGYGGSDKPDGQPVDIASQATYLAEVLDVLEVERATVVGHDIGGGVAQILALRHADRVERLGLVNSVCYDSWPIPEVKMLQKVTPAVGMLPPGLTTAGLKLWLRRGFAQKDRAGPFLDKFLKPFSTDEGLHVFLEHARAADSRYTEELAPELSTLRIPVAVVWGRQDPFQKPEYAERLAQDIPTAELTWVEDASHFSPADAPEPVAAALEELLDRS